ncbi:MAG: prenyltransferase/squalene oxidase repeat-containing protein [Planctomycetaceae bacterium]
MRGWLESTLSELRRLSLGTLISLGVHALLLGLLALFVLREPTEDFSSLLGGWSSRAARRNREPPPVPVEISPVAPVGPVARAGAEARREQEAGALPTPVRAPTQVAVQGALAARRRDLPRPQRFELGSTAESETAVDRGLTWLARQQADDGHWSLDQGYPDPGSLHTDTGATALALLCFLGAGHTTTVGDHASQVAKGVEWLLAVQKRGGEQPGDFYDSQQEGENASFYAHAQATMALAELLVLEPTPRLKQAVEAGLGHIHAAQHPRTGGWKYRSGAEGDLSVFGWQLLALQTGRMAGLQPPPGVLERASGFLDLVQLENGSRYRYEPNSRSGSPAMTAEGLLCRQYLGWPADHPALREGVRFLLEEPQRPRWQAGRRNVYQWYYTAQVLHNLQGEEWRAWEEELRREVVLNQVKAGRQALGSWHPRQPPGHPDENVDKGGRLYLTCLCVLCLEVNYRHLPLYQLANDASEPDPSAPDENGPVENGPDATGPDTTGPDAPGRDVPDSEPAERAEPSGT